MHQGRFSTTREGKGNADVRIPVNTRAVLNMAGEFYAHLRARNRVCLRRTNPNEILCISAIGHERENRRSGIGRFAFSFRLREQFAQWGRDGGAF
jgi:hypothetical protein